MNVVGLDLSLVATGVAYSDGTTATVKTKAETPIMERLEWIRTRCYEAVRIDEHADLVVIEDFVVLSNASSLLGMLHGVVRHNLWANDVRCLFIPPSTLKKFATGKGNATKPDMRVALKDRTGIDLRDDNQCDAYWLRLLGLHLLGEPAVQLPQTHTDALKKVVG